MSTTVELHRAKEAHDRFRADVTAVADDLHAQVVARKSDGSAYVWGEAAGFEVAEAMLRALLSGAA